MTRARDIASSHTRSFTTHLLARSRKQQHAHGAKFVEIARPKVKKYITWTLPRAGS
jgi:hypothetical protein